MPTWEQLKSFPVCRGLGETDLKRLAGFVEQRTLSEGESPFGAPGSEREGGAVFLIEGNLLVGVPGPRFIGAGTSGRVEIGPGEMLAELSLFEVGPPLAEARSVGRSLVLFLPRAGYESWAARSAAGAVLFQAGVLRAVGHRIRRLEGVLRAVAEGKPPEGILEEGSGPEEGQDP